MATPFFREPLPAHSAHVGQELEVYYRWHPYFGRKVNVRRVEHRATGQFLKVLGPSGAVVSMAAWMLDPVVCAGMTSGAPQVDLPALSELKRLVTVVAAPPHSRRDDGFAREKVDEAARRARVELGQTDEPDIRTQPDRRDERNGTDESRSDACPDSDAGRRHQHRGACR
ncbi:hypothetical protein EXZ48_23165 [Shinella sp. JR1-6]|nr:hypothetical protein EXZ48_23165 [Shinella sp. JR1-6]